jgi:hypothetical protein
MKDISYHILDIVQNSLNAGAGRIEVTITEESVTGRFELKISDNGCGMSEETLRAATDPFFTSSVTKKVGLGLPLLKQNAEMTGGTFDIKSMKGEGTEVTAVFDSLHIDMIPVGDLAMTFRTIIAANPDRNLIYRHCKDGEGFNVDTEDIRNNLEGVPMNTPEVLNYIVQFIRENLQELNSKKNQ